MINNNETIDQSVFVNTTDLDANAGIKLLECEKDHLKSEVTAALALLKCETDPLWLYIDKEEAKRNNEKFLKHSNERRNKKFIGGTADEQRISENKAA